MLIKNDYYSIACNDYKYLLHTMDLDFYNNMAVACQQICEKALKSVLLYVNPNAKSVIKSNNLRHIYNAINEREKVLDLDEAKLSLLKDYYFEVRYPGDNFTIVSKEEFDNAYQTLLNVLNEVNRWRVSCNLEVDIPSTSLKSEQQLKSENTRVNFKPYKDLVKEVLEEQQLNVDIDTFMSNISDVVLDKEMLTNLVKEIKNKRY